MLQVLVKMVWPIWAWGFGIPPAIDSGGEAGKEAAVVQGGGYSKYDETTSSRGRWKQM